jgi:hypothetical protein
LDGSAGDDFKAFLGRVWASIGLPKPTKIQLDIADYLANGPRRRMVQAFRGVGKSWVTGAYIVWRLKKNPDTKILVVSASKTHADNTTTFCLQIIKTLPECEFLIPSEDQREAKIQFDVRPVQASRDPSVKSIGITGQITGSRADLIIADDVETSKNSETQVMREKIKTGVEEFAAVLKPGGDVVYLGTPQCEDSLYRTLPSKGYQIRMWPARYPNPKTRAGYGDQLSPLLTSELALLKPIAEGTQGPPTDSERFSEQDLLEREAEYARSGFALQFMLDTSLSDATRYPLKLTDLIIMHLNPEVAPPKVVWAASDDLIDNDLPNVGFTGDRLYKPMQIQEGQWLPFTGSVMTIDPSGRGQDETGYCVIKMLHGQLFVTAWGGLIGGYSTEVLKELSKIAKAQRVNHVIVESNFGDGMFGKLLTPHLGYEPEEIRHNTQKERRIIDTLEPVLNSHKLIIDRQVILKDYSSVEYYSSENKIQYTGLYQLTRVTKDRGALKRDDRLDALAMAVAYWVEHMARDTDLAVLESQNEALDKELESFLEHATGGPQKESTWLSSILS